MEVRRVERHLARRPARGARARRTPRRTRPIAECAPSRSPARAPRSAARSRQACTRRPTSLRELSAARPRGARPRSCARSRPRRTTLRSLAASAALPDRARARGGRGRGRSPDPAARRASRRRRARRRRLRRQAARRVHVRSAADLRGRSVQRPLRRRGVVRASSCRSRRHEELAWRTRIEGSLGHPEREFNGPTRGWQDDLPRRHRRARRRLPRRRRRRAGSPARRAAPSCATLLYDARVRRRVRRARVRRQPRPRGLDARSSSPATCSRAATPTTRCAAVPEPHATATRSSSAPDRPARPRPTCSPSAGWSVIMLEKGRNHLLALDAPFGPLGHVSNDEIKFIRRHFLGPDPFLEPRTYRRDDDDGDRLFAGEVNNLPSTVGGGGFHADGKLPRFRAVDFKARSRARPDRGRRHRRLAGRLRRDGAVLRRGRAPRRRRGRRRREPVRGVAQPVRTRCRPAPTCSARCSPPKPRPASATTRTARRPA